LSRKVQKQAASVQKSRAGLLERFGDHLHAPILRVASPDVPVPFSPVLENAYRPDVPRIAKAVRQVWF
jgi:pyruvate/2-oxoglutarate/acetoin dehydrogenase E1 component